jgi:CelD/BcsL family acetyltransferase involved in cellulose biosynthesis
LVRPEREVRLNFWFGPKKIASAKFLMEVDNRPIDPFGVDLAQAPDQSSLGPKLDGVYRSSEPLSPATPLLTVGKNHIRYVESSFEHRFIDLRTDFESYMAQFSGKTRSSIKRKVRKFKDASNGEIEWSVHRSATEMDRFHALASEISKLTYQEKLFVAGIPTDAAFLDEMRALADADAVRGFLLFLDGKPISYLYLPIDNGRVIYDYLGFDPACAKYSPGTVLQLLALELLFSENTYQVFDFTEGDGAHKKLFSTNERHCGNVFYLRPTIRNRLILRLHLVVRWSSEFANGVIVKLGLKERLRQMLRGQFRKS